MDQPVLKKVTESLLFDDLLFCINNMKILMDFRYLGRKDKYNGHCDRKR